MRDSRKMMAVLVAIVTSVGLLGMLGASEAGASGGDATLTLSYSGVSTGFSDPGCGFHTTATFPMSGELNPGPKVAGTISMDYCTNGITTNLTGTWTIVTKQGTLSGHYEPPWSATSIPTPGCTGAPAQPGCPAIVVGLLYVDSGTKVFTRFHGGVTTMTMTQTALDSGFPTLYHSLSVGSLEGGLTK